MVTEQVEISEEERLAALVGLGVLDTPPEERFDRITRLAAQLFGVHMASVTLIDRDRAFLKSRVGLDVEEADRRHSFCNIAIRRPEMFVVEDARLHEDLADNPFVTDEPHVRFYAGQPLEAPGGARVGTLCIFDERPRQLSEPERDLLRDLAMWVQKELVVEEELRRASEVQRSLLPVGAPEVPGYGIAAACIPSSSVGGDFFDWYDSAGGLTLTVGDVMGKGMSAAILTATVRAVLRAGAAHPTVAASVEQAATILDADLSASGSFATLFHARLDPLAGVLRYVDAGHGLAGVLDTAGVFHQVPRGGLPLGALPGSQWPEGTVELAKGDRVLIVSDGLFDLFGGNRNSLQRIAAVVARASSAQDTVDRLVRRVGTADDDVTVLVVERMA